MHKKVTHFNFFAGIFLSYLPEQFVEIQKFYNRGNVTLWLFSILCVQFSLISRILFLYLFRILTSMAGWCKSILSAEQKKSDFRPEEHELGLVQRTVVSWSSSQNNVINAASEPSNGLITICYLMSSLVDAFRRGGWVARNRERSFAHSILLFLWFLLLEFLETATQSTRQARENL